MYLSYSRKLAWVYSQGNNREKKRESQSIGAFSNFTCITLGQHSIASKQATWSATKSEWDGTTLDGKGHRHRKGRELEPWKQFTTLHSFIDQERPGMDKRGQEIEHLVSLLIGFHKCYQLPESEVLQIQGKDTFKGLPKLEIIFSLL